MIHQSQVTLVRERTTREAETLSGDQEAAIRTLANDLHRLNHSMIRAVESGLSVELVRSSRHHGGNGHFGDLMMPRFPTGALTTS